jgi:hypothetical protein
VEEFFLSHHVSSASATGKMELYPNLSTLGMDGRKQSQLFLLLFPGIPHAEQEVS